MVATIPSVAPAAASASASASASVPSLPVDSPVAPGSDQAITIFVVDISARGEISVNQKPVADDAAFLVAAQRARETHPVVRGVIRADQNAKHGVVIHVMDLLKQAGIAKLAIAVGPK